MHRFLLFFPFTLFLLTATGLQATVFPVEVEGGDEELRSNISAHLGEIDLGSVEQLPSHLPAMNKSIRSALEALGYYEGEWSIGTDRTGLNIKNRALLPGSRVIKVNVSPGKPVLIRKLDIRFSGSGEQQAEVVQLMRGLPLKERHRLRHWQYDQVKVDLLRTLLATGYLDARYRESRLVVNKQEYWADITLLLETGERYQFGSVSYSGSELNPILLDRLVDFQQDAYFSDEAFQKIRSRLSRSGYFERIDVRSSKRLDAETQSRYFDVLLNLKDQEAHYVDVGAGYSTDSGAKASLGWRWPRVSPGGNSLNGTLEVSAPEQKVDFGYRIPLKRPLVESLDWKLSWKSTQLENTETKVTSLGVFYRNLREDNWQFSYGADFDLESYKAGESETEQVLYVVPGASWQRSEIAEGLDPDSGYLVRLGVEGSHPSLGSDTTFFKTTFTARWLTRLYSPDWLLLTRMELGAILTNSLEEVPLSRRYFTGGDQSVRGFEYGSISPRNEEGDVIGGKFLNVFSAEVNYRILESWRLGVFYDTGRAFSDQSDPFFSSVGPGIRWLSPFGQIRFDLAFPLKGNDASNPRLHISLGKAL